MTASLAAQLRRSADAYPNHPLATLAREAAALIDATGVVSPIDQILRAVRAEYVAARAAWPPYHSAHEGLGVLHEEVRELEGHVFTKQRNRDLAAMRKEALQVAQVAISFALDVCDEERGRR